MAKKCNGGIVWPDDNTVPPWQEVVSFNPKPHEYNTLNLPSWDAFDYPVLNQTKPNKKCDLKDKADDHGTCYDLTRIKVITNPSLARDKTWEHGYILKHSDHYSKYSNDGKLYYPGNALHWDSSRQGATNLYWDNLSAADVGFQVGRSLYPSAAKNGGVIAKHDAARYMDNVYGIQFEWDSGRAFGADGHSNDTTSTSSDGYQLQDLVLFYTMLDQNGKAWRDACIVLVKDKDLRPGICYWYEGYSLLNGNEDWQVPGQGTEDTQPRRSGKCGFAINSGHVAPGMDKDQVGATYSGYSMLRDCSVDGWNYNNETPNATVAEKWTRRIIWTSMFIGFHSKYDAQNYRKNFRMWNCKPITVPVKYKDQTKRHDPDPGISRSNYKPWENTDPQVIIDPEMVLGVSKSEQVLPTIFHSEDANANTPNDVRVNYLGKKNGDRPSFPLMCNKGKPNETAGNKDWPDWYEEDKEVYGEIGVPDGTVTPSE